MMDAVERIILGAYEDGGIYVFPVAVPLDVSRELACDWRAGDPW